jgi:hypothetical protein
MPNDEARNLNSPRAGSRSRLPNLRYLCVICLLVSGCSAELTPGESLRAGLAERQRVECARFERAMWFTDFETPGTRLLHPELAVLAPAMGVGVCVPNVEARPDGAHDAPRWGKWTYVYVAAKRQPGTDGEPRWHFSSDELPLGLEAEGEYVDNEPNGPWTFWHPNGQLRAQGSFVKGSVEGPWTFWSDTGIVDATRSGEYAAGKLTLPTSAGSAAR